MNFPTTPTPNTLYDLYLPQLKESELKVLLAVVRQTLGWVDSRTGNRKKWDRITVSQFTQKTGLSPKSITGAIQALIDQNLIEVRDREGHIMQTPEQRRRAYHLFYAIGSALSEGTRVIR